MTSATVAFLGAGRMGLPMASNLLRAGFPVRVWNRTPSRLDALARESGAVLATTPVDAVDGAKFVITMLTDGPAVESVMTGPDGALTAASRDLVWAQMSTVGVAWTDRFVATAASHDVAFVDAPVSGSEGPAVDAQLLILASGPEHVQALLDPVFDAMGRQTMWLGPAGNGNRVKLVLNNWLVDLVEATAETVNFARHLQLDPAVVLDLLESSPLGSPYAVGKARTMLSGDFAPNFALKHALKDALLALDAARESQADLPLTDALVARWQPFSAAGHGDDDVAAVYAAL